MKRETVVLATTVYGHRFLGVEAESTLDDVVKLVDVRAITPAVPPETAAKVADLVEVTLLAAHLVRMWTAPTRKEVLEMAKVDGGGQNFYLLGE